MKKRIACLLTALVVLSCATPVLAAPSAETTQPKVEATAKAADGTEVAVTVEQSVVESVKTEAAAEATKAAAAVSADTKATVLAVVEINLLTGTTMPEGGLTLTISAEGIKAGDNVVLLHQKADGTWETIVPSEVKDGAVVATFKSLSPVAIVELETPATTAGTDTPAETAPKAGASLVLPVAALVCAAGATVCGRKVKFN